MSFLALKDLPPTALISVRISPARCVLAFEGDAWGGTPQQWHRVIYERAWPALLDVVTRRGLTPAGEWTVVVDDGADWRAQVGEAVQARVDAEAATNPAFHVLGVAHLVDTADLVVLDVPSEN
jgi:hypothetical protein